MFDCGSNYDYHLLSDWKARAWLRWWMRLMFFENIAKQEDSGWYDFIVAVVVVDYIVVWVKLLFMILWRWLELWCIYAYTINIHRISLERIAKWCWIVVKVVVTYGFVFPCWCQFTGGTASLSAAKDRLMLHLPFFTCDHHHHHHHHPNRCHHHHHPITFIIQSHARSLSNPD